MQEHDNLVVVCTAQGDAAAAIIKGRLESEGIPVLLSYESVGGILGVIVDGIGEVRIMVPEPFAGDAKRVLEETGQDNGSSGPS